MAPMTLAEIADRIEIDDLLTRYATAVDRKDWELFASCFTPDALIDYTAAGGIKGNLHEIKKWLAEVLPMFPMTQHLITNKVVEVRGDRATSRCILFNPMGLPDGKGSMALFIDGAYYNDELVRTEQGWRMAKRVIEYAYTTRSHAILPPS
jgi:3-phenylpropionate/cinnamic acid dioxygenase small subunit